MNILQLVSIFVELLIVVISLVIAVNKKKIYGYGFALTFGVYVFYDLSRLFLLNIPEAVLTSVFFIATLSALFSIWKLYKD